MRLISRADPRTFARLALAVLLSTGACSALHRGGGSEDETDVVTVVVTNQNLLNVTVFNVAQGHRDRLGEVTTATSSTFKLHLRRLSANELRLLADPIGSPRGVTSELLHLTAGDEVHWILESDLSRSHVEIR